MNKENLFVWLVAIPLGFLILGAVAEVFYFETEYLYPAILGWVVADYIRLIKKIKNKI